MPGVFFNVILIIVGSVGGMLIKNGLSPRFKITVSDAVGLASLFLGITSALTGLMDENVHSLLFIVSLVVGGVLGEWIDIDERLLYLGKKIESKTGTEGFAKGFVSASLLFCVGSMAIIGSLEAGILGDYKTLMAKSVMDGVASVVLASSFGIGVMFSAISVFLYQGAITLLAGALESYLTVDMIREITIIGGILIFCIGLDLLGIRKVKVANFLPALVIPIIYYLVIR